MNRRLPRRTTLSLRNRERFLTPGPTGNIEVLFEPVAPEKGPTALLCHPHPAGGGNLDNKVVVAMARALREAGYHTLRFNFRGVGASEGTHDGSGAERDDVRAMLQLARTAAQPEDALLLAGYSFGCWVALPVAEEDERVVHLIAIGLPLGLRSFPLGEGGRKPLLVIQGTQDEFGGKDDVLQWASQRPTPPEIVWLETGHFFHGKLDEVEEAVRAYASRR
ncbi:MAG: alpha/beta fold hydrolase [Planctomycetota bacterium]